MAKVKGILNLNVEQDKYFTVWEGKAKDFAHGFSVLLCPEHQCFLYQDGNLIDLDFHRCPKVYPFAKNPEKKEGFFEKRNCVSAKIVCVSTLFDHKVLWGSPRGMLIMDKETGKPCTVGGTGRLYFNIINSAKEAKKFYQKFGSFNNSVDVMRRIIFENFIVLMEQAGYPLYERNALTVSERSELSKALMKQLQPVFGEYGIEIASISEMSLIENVVIHQGTPDEIFGYLGDTRKSPMF